MKSLVTKKEEKALRKFLALAPIPEIALSYYELRGFLYGIAITPEAIQPGEWLPLIFSDEMPAYESEDQARELTGALFAVLNKHIAAFHDGSLFMPFDMDNLKRNEIEKVFDWTSGLEEALSLRPECWEEYQGLSEDKHDHLMNSLVIVEGIVYPEDAIDMFEHLPREELRTIGVNLSGSEIEKIAQIQFFMLQALELSVETIQRHAANMEVKRREAIRSSVTPFSLPSSRVGQNALCPCGSGKTFGKCCGIPTPGVAGGSSGSGKKGKLIKVDFPRHRQKKAPKIRPQTGVGVSYQLEVTLSFSKPPVWRRIRVPASMTLAGLHELIQLTMGWQDFHMHSFQAGLNLYGPQQADDFLDMPMLDESRFTLLDLEKELLQGVVYTYDFGDNWEHVIMLEKVIPEREGAASPLLLDGARACPPEDIGGIGMYQELLRYLAGADDGDLRQRFDVPSLRGYDPDSFDRQSLNSLLKTVYGGR